jgi:hypothetical protein
MLLLKIESLEKQDILKGRSLIQTMLMQEKRRCSEL